MENRFTEKRSLATVKNMKHIANIPTTNSLPAPENAPRTQSTRWIAAPRRSGLALMTASALWLPSLMASAPVVAQTAPPATKTQPAVAPSSAPLVNPAAANGVNVLIVGFDDLSLPPAPNVQEQTLAAPTIAAPPAREAPPLIVPGLPVPAQPTAPEPPTRPAITPAAALLTPLAQWRALAKKAPPATDDDEIFRIKPEPMKSYPAPEKASSPTVPAGANSAAADDEKTSPAGTPPVDGGGFGSGIVVPSSPFALGSGSAAGGSSAFTVGASQMAAAPLRRALVGSGFSDVLNAAPSSSTLQRAINSNRLSSRVIENLRVELARLGAATNADADAGAAMADTDYRAAYRAAARIGQAVGYRAVVAMGVLPQDDTNDGNKAASFVVMVVDAGREEGDQLVFQETGTSMLAINDSAALTASAYITRQTTNWPALTERDKLERANAYMVEARASAAAGETQEAQDMLNQVLAFDPNRAEARLLLADVLRSSDPQASARVYTNVLELNGGDGETWAKAAVAYTLGELPDWPASLKAANKALAMKFDSPALRQAMATAQLGRASLFRNADRIESAETAEAEAEKHLNRALEMAPDDPALTRLMMRQLVQSGRYRQALLAMDRIVVQYPNDVELQSQYAIALLKVNGRDEDAFAAWARVISLSGEAPISPDTFTYGHLAEGFDQREANIGKRAGQLSASVAAANTSQGAALVQMNRYAQDAEQSSVAIKALPPTLDGRGGVLHASRVAAADLISQAVANHQTYLETGQAQYRDRANELHRNAIVVINAARTGR